MKHAHEHTHPGQDGQPDTQHSHFHEHPGLRTPLRDSHAEHVAGPHEHEHTTREVTIKVTFTVGTLEEIGLGGFKVGWLDAEQAGREYSLSAGAGVGSPYLEASVRGPGDQPSVYAQADIRTLVSLLWNEMTAIQGELAEAAKQDQEDGE